MALNLHKDNFSFSSFMQLLKQAIRGDVKEFTEGSIDKAIFLLAVPMILEMLLESTFAIVDIFFVSKLGVNAIATVGLTESVITLIYSIAIGMSMAATAIVARRVGEKNPEEAGRTAVQAIYMAIATSVVISIVGFVFAEDVLRWMGADEEVVQYGKGFTRIQFSCNLVIILLFLNNAIFRGAGDAAVAMRALWLANGLNILLCPLYIFGFGWGLEGAAWATVTGRGIGVLYQFYHLAKNKGIIRILPDHFRPNLALMKEIVEVGAWGTLQFLIGSASWIFLGKINARFGSDAVAGYTIGIRVIVFAILPAWGMANAAATLVGQNLGAGKPERAERSAWRTAFINMIFLAAVTVIFFVFARTIISWFNPTPTVLEHGILTLKVICLGYVLYAYGMVLGQSFNGAGDTKTPTILHVVAFWGIQIPLAYFLAVGIKLGPIGVYAAITLAEAVLALLCIWLFKKGKWKTMQV